MSKSESKETKNISTTVANMIEKTQDNVNTITSEVAKLQLQYNQSISSLQTQYIETARNIIQNTLLYQKSLPSVWNNFTQSTVYSDQIKDQSNEFINNYTKAINFGNQIAVNSIDMVSENIKNYTRSLRMLDEYNRNLFHSWNSFFIRQSN